MTLMSNLFTSFSVTSFSVTKSHGHNCFSVTIFSFRVTSRLNVYVVVYCFSLDEMYIVVQILLENSTELLCISSSQSSQQHNSTQSESLIIDILFYIVIIIILVILSCFLFLCISFY